MSMFMKRAISILKFKLWLRRSLVRFTWIFVKWFALYYCLLFCWNIVFWKNHRSHKIYIPETNENLYLVYRENRYDIDIDIKLSTCNWLIYHLPKHEYNLIADPVYYKVSNDSLFLIVNDTIPKPKNFRAKTKIIQITRRAFFRTSGYSIWTEKEHDILESQGYQKFP